MWRLNPRSSLHYRRWGNEWVVFDEGSGQTHEMDTMSAVSLMHCENGWISLSDIRNGVMTDLGLSSPNTLADSLALLLNQFSNLGLLEHALNEDIEPD